ncbi:MAG: PfkB family carbohydrate kinase [Bacillota bacterium]|nr:PfkB family carbohydrate kinase [Bacillota bacterium]
MFTEDSKIISIEKFQELCKDFRKKGLKVVHCHGVFDLLHPGHIMHLQQAKKLGDILLVSITAAEYVLKGPGRPYFPDDLRMKSTASLSCVDYVILSEAETALEILDSVQPDIYVKGAEYEEMNKDLTQNIKREFEKVNSHGGKVHFTGGQVFSSTKLLNNEFPVLSTEAKEFLKDFSSRNSFADIRDYIESMRAIKILVIGDIIIDQYVFCTVQGLSSKDRALSALYEREETYPGGALAVARHLTGFSDKVSFCSMIGNEPRIHSLILDELSSEILLDLQYDANFQTVIKRRYIERRGIRNDYDKLFSINYMDAKGKEDKVDREAFYEKLKNKISDYDLVVLSDFGHGLVDEKLIEIIQDNARFLAINCQTNSANYGDNLITKYRRADVFTIDERELKLAFSGSNVEIKAQLQHLTEQFNSRMGCLTLGSRGAVGIGEDNHFLKIPALTLEVQDTVGAGDAFFSIASLCARAQVPMEIAGFLASVAGALAANILGNSQAVDKVKLLKYASTLLNY